MLAMSLPPIPLARAWYQAGVCSAVAGRISRVLGFMGRLLSCDVGFHGGQLACGPVAVTVGGSVCRCVYFWFFVAVLSDSVPEHAVADVEDVCGFFPLVGAFTVDPYPAVVVGDFSVPAIVVEAPVFLTLVPLDDVGQGVEVAFWSGYPSFSFDVAYLCTNSFDSSRSDLENFREPVPVPKEIGRAHLCTPVT